LHNIQEIIDFEGEIKGKDLTPELYVEAKKYGFSDKQLAGLLSVDEIDIYKFKKERGLVPNYKLVDTCGAEFEAYTPYYYSTYDGV
jgi:carbamoyl-phosphate synthase large subunit